ADLKLKPDQVALLRDFVRVCQIQPSVLNVPELGFFRDWLKKIGATLPETSPPTTSDPPKEKSAPAPTENTPDLLDLDDDDITDIPLIAPDPTADGA
ncbi:hypothetical protein, partial [Salmonella sp. s51228]|uniref:hypothetical protein n=1 Tax=Salmonella sp. s51228 TaxID=3159652 RepID=UPI00397E97E4